MPHRISREEAIARLARDPESACRLCDLSRRGEQLLARGEHAVVLLSRYPVRWGHAMVVPRAHVERFAELDPLVWQEACALAHRTARAVERLLQPSRCYVASLGTSERGLPMTFTHLHLNVIPVPEPAARPREVLTWEHGVAEGTPDEWARLLAALRGALEG